jgi:predicted DNA-binding antitoxin AbrB/MazE fold protein
MTQIIFAIFDDGVFTPSQPVNLPEHSRVRLTVEPINVDEKIEGKLATMQAFWKKTKPHSSHMTRDQLNERR